MKLTIELVPSTSWWYNLWKVLPKTDWDVIRKRTYARYGHRCGICNAHSRLNCHENWQYDDENHVQKLDGFIALCDLCHHVKHIGLAGILSNQGRLDYEKVIEHFRKVNNCSREDFLEHRRQAFKILASRSRHEWQIDFGEYEYLRNRVRVRE